MARLVVRVNMSPHLYQSDEENKRLVSLGLTMGPWQSKTGLEALLRDGVTKREGQLDGPP